MSFTVHDSATLQLPLNLRLVMKGRDISCLYPLFTILSHPVYWLDRDKVAACAKHFVGDGGTYEGINENNTIIDRHGLLSIHMPAYYNAIIKGVSTVMVSFSSWNGVKMHANRGLITGFLKNTLKFRVSDTMHCISSSESFHMWKHHPLFFILSLNVAL